MNHRELVAWVEEFVAWCDLPDDDCNIRNFTAKDGVAAREVLAVLRQPDAGPLVEALRQAHDALGVIIDQTFTSSDPQDRPLRYLIEDLRLVRDRIYEQFYAAWQEASLSDFRAATPCGGTQTAPVPAAPTTLAAQGRAGEGILSIKSAGRGDAPAPTAATPETRGANETAAAQVKPMKDLANENQPLGASSETGETLEGDVTAGTQSAPAPATASDTPDRWRVKDEQGDDLITFWKSRPPPSNEVAAAEIIEELECRLRVAEARIRELEKRGGALCEHGVGMADYCLPCGRINGGG